MIYVIKKVSFDIYENRIGDAISEALVGYTDTIEEAEEQMKNLSGQGGVYIAWDNNSYPKYYSIAVERLV